MHFTFQLIILSLLGGVLPAVLWLWFWLKEDEHPEPKKRIVYTFIAGMIAVPLVVPLQAFVCGAITHVNCLTDTSAVNSTPVLIWWAAIEEIFKLLAAFTAGLIKKDNDEPMDAVVYLFTAALGFSALENVLFILNPLSTGNITGGIITGNLRFVGATLLHVISSASIGIAIGFAFYQSKKIKALHVFLGLGIAVALHSLFNFSILHLPPSNEFFVFYGVWLAVVAVAVMMEKVKSIKKPTPLIIN